MASSGSDAGCPDCVFSFSMGLSSSGTDCDDGGGADGGAFDLGVFEDYQGYGPALAYGYYGTWYFASLGSWDGTTLSFDAQRYYDYPYEYNGVQYYYTNTFYGTLTGVK
jgi:hypothetical protein